MTATGLRSALSPRTSSAANVGLHVGIVLVIAVAVSQLGGRVPHPPALAVGSCFDAYGFETGVEPEFIRLPCDLPHQGEVFHVFELDAPVDGSYPAPVDWPDAVLPVCDEQFTAYTGRSPDPAGEIGIDYYRPDLIDWRAGDRHVTCFLFRWDEEPIVGSLRKAPG